jgi:hypothetical protein
MSVVVLVLMALAAAWFHRDRPAPEMAEAVKQFGYAPQPDPSVRYQPDVVLIRGGAGANRGGCEDRLTWTVDGSANGVSDLAPGKIMFATSRAVGRVAAIERRGRDVAVTVGPVNLTEVVRDAKLDFNLKLPPDAFQSYRSVPPQGISMTALRDPGGASLRNALWRPGVAEPQPRPAAWKFSAKVSVGDWEAEPYAKLSARDWYQPDTDPDAPPKPRDSNGRELNEEQKVAAFGLKVQRKAADGKFGPGGSAKYGLKFGADVRLIGKDIRMYGHMEIAEGKVQEPVTFKIEGVDELQIGLLGGAEDGASDNVKLRVELPADLALPFMAGPVPLAVHLKFKVLLETAFSGAYSTMSAQGRYKLDGPIGVENGELVAPSFTVVKPMVKNMGGVLVGPSGIVLAFEFRWLVGLGNELAMFGPYAKITVAFGTSRGSFMGWALGGPLADPLRPVIDCKGVTVKGDLGAGVGLVIDKDWKPILKSLKLKTDSEFVEKTKTFVNERVTDPASKICGAG